MTGKLGGQGLDTLEQRFQALRDQFGAMPEACRPELEGALQELSQAIAALRADREAGENPGPAPPGGPEPQAGQGAENHSPVDPAAYLGPCEAMLRHVFNAIPDLLTVHDRDFNTILSNWHGYESLPEAERRGRPKCYRVYHHRDRPCDGCHALEVMATGQPVKVEKFNPIDGRVREISAYPIRDESGQVVLVVEHVRDITERYLAEEALEDSEATLRTLIEANPESLFLLDTRGVILAASRVAAQRLGKNLEEILGADLHGMLPPEVSKKRFEIMQGVVATGQPARFEDVRGGFYFDSSITPIFDQDKVVQVTVLGVDISLRKQAEAAVQESETLFRSLVENITLGITLISSDYRITMTNPAQGNLFHKNPREFIGKECFREFEKRPAVCPHCPGAIAMATGRKAEIETTGVRDDGSSLVARLHAFPSFGPDGEITGFIEVVEDITQSNQVKEALRESEVRFRHISSTISDLSYSCTAGPDGSYAIDWLAGAAERITGYSVEEIKAQRCWEFLVIEADQPLFEQHITGLAAGSSGACELRLRHKNGGIVWVASFAKIVPEPEQPELLRIYGGLVDITARKQAEAALAAHVQFLQLLLDTIPNPIFFKDAQGAYLGCNKAFENYLGITRQEIVGKSVYDLSPQELADEYHRMDLEAFQATGPQVYESRVQVADGTRRHVVFHKATFPGPTGGLGGLAGMITDITALKQAEAELRQSEQRFRLMAETIQDVFWIATPRIGKTVYVSPGFEYIWGRTSEALYRNPKLFLDTVHPEDRERVKTEIIAARERSIPWSHEYRIIRPDGTVRWIQNRGFPVRDDQGRVTLFTGVATDITEHKALEGQLLQAQKMEAVGRLAGGVAHDFNNLLMAITGYGELMRAKVLKDDPLYGYLENILKAGDRAAALTQQLLTFSRQQIIQPQVIDLNQVVLDLEPMLRRLIGEDLDLEVVTDPRPEVVNADPGQMGQIIMNLVVNARDAMPQGGRLTLKTAAVDFVEGRHSRFGLAPPGAYVMLVAQDNGVGMDEATQAHVFEPFFTTKEPGKGTGLGLSTVYGIVKQSGGYLDLESSPGAGSTFTLYLPRLEAVVEPPKVKVPLTASFRGEETVLLVEDEDMLRGLLAKFLRLCGYTVLEARHGGEALLACERHPGPINLMVTDVVMPQMSGRELADRLTPLRPEMKILYMSGYTEDALVQHGVAKLSVAFLQKPFRPIELVRRVHAVLHPPVSH
jgi:two-component system cell cycle sensor histidine kinase/response regulator CckA